MLGHRGQGCFGGPGPSLGRGQVAGVDDAVHPELEERPGLGHGPGQGGSGSLRERSPGSLPLGRSATTTSTSCLRSHS